jgi:SAM-dependent methyltransferase
MDADAGSRYARGRWKSPRAAQRDPVLVDRILTRYGTRPTLRPVLDAPCGTGRLRPMLERRGLRYVGLDLSPSMLGEARGAAAPSLVQGSVARLPFRDESFDVVVCCRLLHHLDEHELEPVLSELARVAHRLVVASFWDAASLHALRRRVGLRKSEGERGRRAVEKRLLRELFARSGADVVGFHHSFRFVAQQAFVVALKRAPVGVPARAAARARIGTLELDPRGGALGQAPV